MSRLRNVELYRHSSSTSPWCGANLNNEFTFMAWYLFKHRDFTFIIVIFIVPIVVALTFAHGWDEKYI
jgi:hypothetical protein